MARSFPGFFVKKNRNCLGKRKLPALKTFATQGKKNWRPFTFYVYLLNLNADSTPTASEAFALAQAGLGKRHISMPLDMSHEEFFSLLKKEYPKLQALDGGWLLYKSTGGQGKRKLIMIPPDSDGYTGTLLRSVTGAGKNTLGRINQKVLNSDSVADVQLRELIDQVESATEHSKQGHHLLRLQPMLEQLREGLQLYGLLSLMSQYPDICQPLFVSGEDIKVNAEFVMTSILPQLSDKGTTRHQVELEMMNFIQDFLYEAEDHGHVDKDGLHPITPATFLQWITGQGHVPLLPSEKKDFAVVIQFNHDCSADFGPHSVCYPVVTACAKTITLPVRHMRPYEKFKNILTEAFQLGQEFSNV
ncbi:Ribosomal RNA small subunit methyltransferase H [Dissostichus eleginoides]|uniref:Ribosomal RNA small subunit methyltransferase H n=1 Tax=Dissostichus eleginoides TaxID=100907 RepID=A0AAD9FFM6_DISEL|nr:Ribosomal RNA small subunit methyltransferase H [Dissostichus eleginoides]